MVLIQLLLPTRVPDLAEVQNAVAALAATSLELADHFDDLTSDIRSPAPGLWTAPDGHEEHDDVVMTEVVTDTLDSTWWRAYTNMLPKRFGQDEIHIRADAR